MLPKLFINISFTRFILWRHNIRFTQLHSYLTSKSFLLHISKTGATYYAIQEMPLGVSNMILSSKPVFTILFAWIFLRERLFCFDSIPIILMLSGFLLTVQPWNPESKSATAGYQEDFLDSAIILFAATILASNSTIILRSDLMVDSLSIALLAYPCVLFVDQIVSHDQFDKNRKFRKKNLLSMSASRELIVVAVSFKNWKKVKSFQVTSLFLERTKFESKSSQVSSLSLLLLGFPLPDLTWPDKLLLLCLAVTRHFSWLCTDCLADWWLLPNFLATITRLWAPDHQSTTIVPNWNCERHNQAF